MSLSSAAPGQENLKAIFSVKAGETVDLVHPKYVQEWQYMIDDWKKDAEKRAAGKPTRFDEIMDEFLKYTRRCASPNAQLKWVKADWTWFDTAEEG